MTFSPIESPAVPVGVPSADRAARVQAEPAPHVQLIQVAVTIWTARAVYAAAQLGLADLLGGESRSSEELAQASGTHAPSLYRLLRTLAACGILHEVEQRRFALTPLGDALRSDAPGAARATVLTLAGD